jgi:hypothetical protein
MKTIGCPAHIEFLLWVHCNPEPFPREDAPVYRDLIPQLIRLGVIEREVSPKDCWRTTPLGRAWVQALCNVPMPKAAYLDEMGRVL